jgi:hypothetical protein
MMEIRITGIDSVVGAGKRKEFNQVFSVPERSTKPNPKPSTSINEKDSS